MQKSGPQSFQRHVSTTGNQFSHKHPQLPAILAIRSKRYNRNKCSKITALHILVYDRFVQYVINLLVKPPDACHKLLKIMAGDGKCGRKPFGRYMRPSRCPQRYNLITRCKLPACRHDYKILQHKRNDHFGSLLTPLPPLGTPRFALFGAKIGLDFAIFG